MSAATAPPLDSLDWATFVWIDEDFARFLERQTRLLRRGGPAARPARRQAPAQGSPDHEDDLGHAGNDAWLDGSAA